MLKLVSVENFMLFGPSDSELTRFQDLAFPIHFNGISCFTGKSIFKIFKLTLLATERSKRHEIVGLNLFQDEDFKSEVHF